MESRSEDFGLLVQLDDVCSEFDRILKSSPDSPDALNWLQEKWADCPHTWHDLAVDTLRRVFERRRSESLASTNRSVASTVNENVMIEGRFQVRNWIGSGKFGGVYLANDTKAGNRSCALKVLRRSEMASEARTLGSIDHPNVVSLWDVKETHDGRCVLIMKFMNGGTLSERCAQDPVLLPLGDALGILVDVCQGIKAAHDRQIVHRDLKPDNILCDIASSGQQRWAVGDFGLATLSIENLNRNQIVGTKEFMSPEVLRSDVASQHLEKVDLWALGVIFYWVLTREYPFPQVNDTGLKRFELAKQFKAGPKDLTRHRQDISIEVKDLIDDLLSYEPGDRPDIAIVLRRMTSIQSSIQTNDLREPETRIIQKRPMENPSSAEHYQYDYAGSLILAGSSLHIRRECDETMEQYLAEDPPHWHAIRVTGPRLTGKSSLLENAMAIMAQSPHYDEPILIDIESFSKSQRTDENAFVRDCIDLIDEQIEATTHPPQTPSTLSALGTHLKKRLSSRKRMTALVIDNFDMLALSSFFDDLCGTLRTWRNKGYRDDVWKRILPIIVISQDCDLYIRNPESCLTWMRDIDIPWLTANQTKDFVDRCLRKFQYLPDYDLETSRFSAAAHEVLGGHPYVTHLLCQDILKKLREQCPLGDAYRSSLSEATRPTGPLKAHWDQIFGALEGEVSDAAKQAFFAMNPGESYSLDRRHAVPLIRLGLIEVADESNNHYFVRCGMYYPLVRGEIVGCSLVDKLE